MITYIFWYLYLSMRSLVAQTIHLHWYLLIIWILFMERHFNDRDVIGHVWRSVVTMCRHKTKPCDGSTVSPLHNLCIVLLLSVMYAHCISFFFSISRSSEVYEQGTIGVCRPAYHHWSRMYSRYNLWQSRRGLHHFSFEYGTIIRLIAIGVLSFRDKNKSYKNDSRIS